MPVDEVSIVLSAFSFYHESVGFPGSFVALRTDGYQVRT
jgi:hypothetical protein